jgi:hypothetical protein
MKKDDEIHLFPAKGAGTGIAFHPLQLTFVKHAPMEGMKLDKWLPEGSE